MRSIIYKIIFLLPVMIMVVLPALAQGPGGPPKTPIDGGLSLLLVAGGAYGIKKLRDFKN